MGEQDVLKMQQRKDFLIKFCYWAVIAVCVYAVFKYLLPVLFPFVLAYGIAYMLANPVRRIAGKSRWKRVYRLKCKQSLCLIFLKTIMKNMT